MIQRIGLIVIASIVLSCGNSGQSADSSEADSTVNSITPTPSDSTTEMAPMMGDTSQIEVDSSLKE